jgi:isopentenyl-diphosphate Delta-isomerase
MAPGESGVMGAGRADCAIAQRRRHVQRRARVGRPIVGAANPESGQVMLELVDAEGRGVGVAEKIAAHMPPGQLHRACSVFLFDDRDRMLLQQRATGKYHSPGTWSNTCCGHPFPGEPPRSAALRRLREELGITPTELLEIGTVRYELRDPRSGLVEHEYNHVYIGRVRQNPRPDPGEVGETAFVTSAQLAALRAREPFSVWFATVAEVSLAAVRAGLFTLDAWS